MNFNKLRHVIAVDQVGSVSGAAERLNLTQSTVTKSVAEIEEDLGHPIFERKSFGMQATEEGREFLLRAARIVSDMEMFTEEVRTKRKLREKVLKIGVSPPLIGGLLNRAILHLAEEEPDLRIHITSMLSEACILGLRRGDIDVAIGPEVLLKADNSFDVIPLGALYGHLFVRKGHPLTRMKKIRPSDITDFPFITTDYSNHYMNALREVMLAQGKEPFTHTHVMESFPMTASMVEKTDCMAAVSVDYGKSDSFRSRFAVLELDIFPPYALGFAHSAHKPKTRMVNALLRALRLYPVTTDPK